MLDRTNDSVIATRVTRAGWILAIALGLRYLWIGRFEILGDGVSYLDIGDAFARGDWANAINAYWSPLYAWLLGTAVGLANQAPQREYLVVAAANFGVYLFALATFTSLLKELWRWQQARVPESVVGHRELLPQWMFLAIGYAVFCWCSLRLLSVWQVTPDMAVSGIVYYCSGLILRLRGGETGWRVAAALGAALGIGYLVKAPMFVLAPAFLVCAAFAMGLKRSMPRIALAAGVFALIAAPLVTAISVEKGRFSFGDSGRVNLAWNTFKVPRPFWTGEPAGSGAPVHPVRVLNQDPEVFEFARPIAVTYPPWHDPSYWNDGLAAPMTWRTIESGFDESRLLFRRLFDGQFLFFAGLVALGLFSSWSGLLRGGAWLWPVWAPAAAGIGLFALVGAESRYIAPFVGVGMIAAVSLIRLPAMRPLPAWRLALAGLLVISPAKSVVSGAVWPERLTHSAATSIEVAHGLNQLGVRPGDQIALVRGHGGVYFARLAGVQIVAEVPDARAFWKADAVRRGYAIEAITHAGAAILVAPSLPEGADRRDWVRLGSTSWHAHVLRPLTAQ